MSNLKSYLSLWNRSWRKMKLLYINVKNSCCHSKCLHCCKILTDLILLLRNCYFILILKFNKELISFKLLLAKVSDILYILGWFFCSWVFIYRICDELWVFINFLWIHSFLLFWNSYKLMLKWFNSSWYECQIPHDIHSCTAFEISSDS